MTDTPETTYSFGEYIRYLRLSRHVSLTAAAKKMGMTPQKLSDIESGRRYNKRINLTLVQKASECYDVPINEIAKNVQTSISHQKTISDLMRELVPLARMSELLAQRLYKESEQLPTHVEELAHELFQNVSGLVALVNLMNKQHFSGARNDYKKSNY